MMWVNTNYKLSGKPRQEPNMQFDLNYVRIKNKGVKRKLVKILTVLMPYMEKSCMSLLFIFLSTFQNHHQYFF